MVEISLGSSDSEEGQAPYVFGNTAETLVRAAFSLQKELIEYVA